MIIINSFFFCCCFVIIDKDYEDVPHCNDKSRLNSKGDDLEVASWGLVILIHSNRSNKCWLL